MPLNLYEILSDLPNRQSQEIVNLVLRYAKIRSFIEGETIVKEGERSDSVYIILSGKVDVCKTDIFGKSFCITRSEEGSIIGEMGVFMDMKRSATMIARTDVKTAQFTNEIFLNSVALSPDLLLRLFKSFAENLYITNQKLIKKNEEKGFLAIGFLILTKTTQTPDSWHEVYLGLETDLKKYNLEKYKVQTILKDFTDCGVITNLETNELGFSFGVHVSTMQTYLNLLLGQK